MHTVKCPYCGYENLCTNIRCEYCGNDLKLKKQNFGRNNEENSFFKVINFYYGVILIFVGVIISSVSSWILFTKGLEEITNIISVPFLICGIVLLISGISWIVKGININKNTGNLDEKLNREIIEKKFFKIEKIINFIYTLAFFLFWFGFLTLYDILVIKSWDHDGKLLFFFSLFLWVIGVYFLIKSMKKFK